MLAALVAGPVEAQQTAAPTIMVNPPVPAVGKLAFAPDGNWIAETTGDVVRLWEVKTGRLLRIINPHGPITMNSPIAISGDGRVLTVNLLNRTITTWNTETGAALRTLSRQAADLLGYTDSFAMSADGSTIIGIGSSKGASRWNAKTGKPLNTFSVTCLSAFTSGPLRECASRLLYGFVSPTPVFALAPDGQLMAVGYEKDDRSPDVPIGIWNPATGKLIRMVAAHTDAVTALAISANGRWLVSGSKDASVKIWDLHTGRLERTLSGNLNPVRSLAVSPDGQSVAAISDKNVGDQALYVWNFATGARRFVNQNPLPFVSIYGFAFAPDSRSIAMPGLQAIDFFNAETGSQVRHLAFSLPFYNGMALAPNGQWVVSSFTKAVTWDPASGQPIQEYKIDGQQMLIDLRGGMAEDRAGRWIAAGWTGNGAEHRQPRAHRRKDGEGPRKIFMGRASRQSSGRRDRGVA